MPEVEGPKRIDLAEASLHQESDPEANPKVDPEVDPDVGLERSGAYARSQLEAAARDPRLDRPHGAVVADYLAYLDEADRVRMLTLGAVFELGRAPLLVDGDASARQAAWERREMAQLEVAGGHAHINALTLIGMFGNMDGFVEQLTPFFRDMASRTVDGFVDESLEKGLAEAKDEFPDTPSLDAEQRRLVREAIRSTLPAFDGKIPRITGQAPERWESVLSTAGLGPDDSYPLPQSLADALSELTELRNVLVHRAGRLDEKALEKCPRLATHLHYEVGQFVRIDRPAYRRYSAALRAYGTEVQRRIFRATPSMRDIIKIELADWASHYYIGA